MYGFLYSEVNIICIAMVAVVAVKLSSSSSRASAKNRWFMLMTWLVLAANVSDFLFSVCISADLAVPAFIKYIINLLYFGALTGAAYCWFIYVEQTNDSDVKLRKKRLWLYSIPLVAFCTCLLVSCFNGMIFYINETGNYCRGKFFFLQPILSYIYIYTAAIRSALAYFKKKHYAYKSRILTLHICALVIMICGAAQLATPNYPLVTAAISLSIIYVYIGSLTRLVSLDPLTGIPNRRELISHLSGEIKTLKSDEKICFFFIDIDGFKQINDTFGHDEGDRVLKHLATEMRRFCIENGGYCARYGGDELVMLQIIGENDDASLIADKLRKRIIGNYIPMGEAQFIDISIGYSECGGECDAATLIARADAEMYKEKEKKHMMYDD